jgi:hypothetical protein
LPSAGALAMLATSAAGIVNVANVMRAIGSFFHRSG